MDKIEKFLKVVDGYGDGDGSGDGSVYGDGSGYGSVYGYGDGDGSVCGPGNGSGSGYGYGSGDGDGSGYGSGYGDGDGYGSGYGDGIKEFNKIKIFNIDGVQTGIKQIKGNVAFGFILNNDFTTTKCYTVKQNNLFAHGKTIREAMNALSGKLFNDMPEVERIEKFIEYFTDIKKEYPCLEFYEWHHKLTGSCDIGRKSFAENNDINIETDKMTVFEFIKLTENQYGGDTIKKLKSKIGGKE